MNSMTPYTPGLKRLRAFDTVVRAGSGLAAAAELRVSQPAIAYSLDQLERELGLRLLERRASGSFATGDGVVFFNRTRRFLDQIGEAVRDTLAASGEPPQKAESIISKLRDTQIAALIAIWRAGGFRAAARRLSVAEPTLQRPARELERLLRVGLYRRTAAGVEVNPVGAELARRLALAVGEIHSGMEEIGALRANERASLRVGVLALSPRVILAEGLGSLLGGLPAQRVDIVEGSYEDHAASIRAGTIDVIFGALRSPPLFRDLVEEPLLEDPYAIVCRVGHPLATADRPLTADLLAYEFILPTTGLPRRVTLDAFFKSHGMASNARVETSCLPTTIALLKASDRLALLSRWHADLDNRDELVCLDSVNVPHLPRFVGLTTRADWLPTPFQATFLAMTRKAAAKWVATKPTRSSKPRRQGVVPRASSAPRTGRNTRVAPIR